MGYILADLSVRYSTINVFKGFGISSTVVEPAQQAKAQHSRRLYAANDSIPEGGRNAALASLAGTMRSRGMSPEAMEAALQKENISRCNPPLDEEEVSRIVASISRYDPSESGDSWVHTRVSLDQRIADIYADNTSDGISVFSYANFSDLTSNPPPARKWLVDEWLPIGSVTVLSSNAGFGKTLTAQQTATHVAAGIPLWGQTVLQGPVIGYLCEDDNDELRRRQKKINAALSLTDTPDGLFLEGRAGKDNTLFTFTSQHFSAPTFLLARIDAECAEKKPVLVIIDNIAQVYAGLENDRHQVTMFCNELTRLAQKHHCCVLLLGHTAKAEGSQFSGSTAWEAAVRTRLWLNRNDDGTMELRKAKANYSGLDSVTLQWQDGYLHTISCGAGGAVVNEAAKTAVTLALAEFTKAKISTSNSPQARNYLPKMMLDQRKLYGINPQAAKNALTAMVDQGEIIPGSDLGWKTSSRHQAMGLKVAIGSTL